MGNEALQCNTAARLQEQHISAREPLRKRHRCEIGLGHDLQSRQGRGGLGHGLRFRTARHDHQTVEAQGRCALCHLAVQGHTLISQFQHGAKDRKTAAGLGRQKVQGRQDRFWRGVVGLIQQGQATELQPTISPPWHLHLHPRELAEGHAQFSGHGEGQEQIAGVVATIERHLEA